MHSASYVNNKTTPLALARIEEQFNWLAEAVFASKVSGSNLLEAYLTFCTWGPRRASLGLPEEAFEWVFGSGGSLFGATANVTCRPVAKAGLEGSDGHPSSELSGGPSGQAFGTWASSQRE